VYKNTADTNPVGMNYAYAGTTGSDTTFSTTAGHPAVNGGPDAALNAAGITASATWNANVADLIAYLDAQGGAGSLPIFYFVNNENTENTLDTWFQVKLYDSADMNHPLVFDFNTRYGGAVTNPSISPYNYSNATDGLVPPQPVNPGDFVLSGGPVWIDPYGNSVQSPTKPTTGGPWIVFEHNLGEDRAAYAGMSPELNSALRSGTYEYMTFASEMINLTNGPEQIFILAGGVIPEPSTYVLLGISLAVIAASRKKFTSMKK
jgi:hypothetical protein